MKCRLKDITNLFLDTGISSNNYAIIELSMVDNILNDKDNSRLHLFEEAAGISKFRKRKKETFNKIRQTESDLDRVEDLVYEIEKNLRSLIKQSKKNSIKPIFAISPGLSLNKYSSKTKISLINKVTQARKLGFKDFAIFFDDIVSKTSDGYDFIAQVVNVNLETGFTFLNGPVQGRKGEVEFDAGHVEIHERGNKIFISSGVKLIIPASFIKQINEE